MIIEIIKSFCLLQYAGSLHLAHGALVEEDKVGPLVMPEQVPSPHGIPQVVTPSPAPSPSPSPFSLNQVCFFFDFSIFVLFCLEKRSAILFYGPCI